MSQEPNSYSYFCNRDCKYFPCHPNADPDYFNCLFCYCPLYALGKNCGGNFVYGLGGIKDCSKCLVPHSRGGYEYVTGKYFEIMQMIMERENEDGDN